MSPDRVTALQRDIRWINRHNPDFHADPKDGPLAQLEQRLQAREIIFAKSDFVEAKHFPVLEPSYPPGPLDIAIKEGKEVRPGVSFAGKDGKIYPYDPDSDLNSKGSKHQERKL